MPLVGLPRSCRCRRGNASTLDRRRNRTGRWVRSRIDVGWRAPTTHDRARSGDRHRRCTPTPLPQCRRMFNQTWKWAGKSRRTDKNIGVSWFEIPVRLRRMLGDVRAQIEHQAYAPVEIAARFHHRLVAIQVFPNGHGRHARLMADLLLTELAGRRFEWSRGSLVAANELRARYIAALQAADAGDCQPLLDFLDDA